jgi:opacity protein-like surface antigen
MVPLICACVCGLSARDAHAQSLVGAPGRFEVTAGVLWMGHESFAGKDATETSPTGGRSRLFSTTTELAAAGGVEARVGVALTGVLQIEASSSYGRPQLRTTIANDSENAATVTAVERVRQFTVEGAALFLLPHWRRGSRTVPFVTAGAGYLRQLHEGETLSVSGRTYQVGGGVKALLRSRAKGIKGVGVRGDARAVVRTKGVAFDSRAHVSPLLAASLFVRF